jgi:hypothetical protein
MNNSKNLEIVRDSVRIGIGIGIRIRIHRVPGAEHNDRVRDIG